MTISGQMKLVAEALADWAKANHGRVFIASDVLAAIDELRARPGTPSVGLLFWSREPRGELGITGRKDNHYKAVISRGRSLKIVSGESLTEGAAGGAPMFDLVEEAEDLVLSARLPEEEGFGGEDLVPSHKGTGLFEVSGMVLDAYEINFSLPAQARVQL